MPLGSPFPLPAHQTGHADFPHPAFRLVSSRAYGDLLIPASSISPPRLGTAIQLVRKAPGLMRCFIRFPEKLEGCSHTGAGLPMSQGYEQRLRMRPISLTREFQAEQHRSMISSTVR